MAKTDTGLTDAEWEAKFNGPRDRLLKRIFGDIPCPAAGISPKVATKRDEQLADLKAKPESVK